jgi:hypothetical protein
VICEEGNEKVCVKVERILAEDVRDLACGSVAEKDVTNCEEKREIENRCETSVDIVPAPLPADEKRSDGWIRMEDFTDGGEPRIDAAKRGVPVRPELA